MQKHDLKLSDRADYVMLTRKVDQAETKVEEWATSLTQIRERRLYLFEYETFEEYCQVHCKRTARWAEKLIAQDKRHQAERLIAETTAEPPEKEPKSATNKSAPVQSKPEQSSAQNRNGTTDKPISSPLPIARAKKPVIEDKIGWPIPEKLHELWKRRDEPCESIRRLKVVKQHLQAILEKKDMMWVEVNFQSCAGDLDRCMRDIERARPHAVCPYCKGRSFDSCTVCNKRGLISEYLWRSGLNADKVFAMHKKEIEKYQNGKAKEI